MGTDDQVGWSFSAGISPAAILHQCTSAKVHFKAHESRFEGVNQKQVILATRYSLYSHTFCLPFPPQLHSNSDKGDGSVRYILDGEGAGTIFIIDEVTGDIHATKSLDREKKTHYVLHAQALDRHTEEALEPKSEFIIKVQDINDNAPKFPDGPFVATVPEMSEVGE